MGRGASRGGGGRFQRGGTLPPLPFGDAAFDLVLAGSVFTHLTADYQDRWLQELRRVLEPGGILIATTLGEFGARIRASDPALAQRLGAIGIDDSMPDRTLDGVVEAGYYRATWQGKAWTEQRWGRAFAVLHHEPAGFENYQDLWILRRPA